MRCGPLGRPFPLNHPSSPFAVASQVLSPDVSPIASYLTDLRANKPARPVGSRPLPSARTNSVRANASDPMPTLHSATNNLKDAELIGRSFSAASHRKTRSAAPFVDRSASALGRPVARPPPEDPSFIQPSRVYLEGGQRWMEKKEAQSLRDALQNMDLDRDADIHTKAQQEASELVWAHQNPVAAKAEKEKPYNYRDHLRKGSHARAQSAERSASLQLYGSMSSRSGSRVPSGASGQSGSSENSNTQKKSLPRVDTRRQPGTAEAESPTDIVSPKVHALWDSPAKKAYMSLTSPPQGVKQQHSAPRQRNVSGGSLFRNPEDQIYEEPEDVQEQALASAPVPAPLRLKHQTSDAKPHFAHHPSTRSQTDPEAFSQRRSRFEIHKNPPSQSRNPNYKVNAADPSPLGSAGTESTTAHDESNSQNNGTEVRGKDINEATSMRLKDRSAKLPTPAIVSDKPGRPIVSFDPAWKPRDSLKQSKTSNSTPPKAYSHTKPAPPKPAPMVASLSMSNPSIPTISLPPAPSISAPAVPQISISNFSSGSGPSIPSISVSASKDRPLPIPSRPLPVQTASAPTRSSLPHYTLSTRRPTASCAQCALPIAGRVVSAASQRFHPECFICYNCGEALECVAFYPEPEGKRDERVERIRARERGEDVPERDGEGVAEDGNDQSRFYCHLDFHELFSPRCRSCKTPIEGEVVVACGGEWHVGHFFCAECGDVSRALLVQGGSENSD
ncbi:MAG: hypothetical protein M1814_004176 [Vezdaea aestivalis]|nr:MAG: hypothetical protein M1814_004176 [Vezdaea aestivalis]